MTLLLKKEKERNIDIKKMYLKYKSNINLRVEMSTKFLKNIMGWWYILARLAMILCLWGGKGSEEMDWYQCDLWSSPTRHTDDRLSVYPWAKLVCDRDVSSSYRQRIDAFVSVGSR